jgi:hypothetical protein
MALSSFTKGMRFANCKRWSVNPFDCDGIYYDVYIVHKTTHKTIQVFLDELRISAHGPRVEGAELGAELIAEWHTTGGATMLNTKPQRFRIKHDDRGAYFSSARTVYMSHMQSSFSVR